MRLTTSILLAMVASSAAAAPVNPNAPDGIACVVRGNWGQTWTILCTDGEVWGFNGGDGSPAYWSHESYGLPLPVPVSMIADFTVGAITTVSGEHWMFKALQDGEQQWHRMNGPEMPPLPCAGTVKQEGSSLGGVKSIFR